MRRTARLLFVLATLVLGAWSTGELVRVLRIVEPAPVELGRVASLRLSTQTRARLAELDGDVLATYYVTRREDMPSEMRRVEADVRTILGTMAAASRGRFRYQVLDPAQHPELSEYVANEGVTPQRLRTVQHDAWSESEVFSTLVLAYAGRAKTRIEGLRPEHVRELQRLVIAHLDETEHPKRPVVAVAGPNPDELARSLGLFDKADVERLALDLDPTIPDDVDVLFWIAPEVASPAHVRSLRLFLDAGGSAVIAGSTLRLDLDRAAVPPRVMRRPDDDTIALLLAEFGLEAAPGALFDTYSMSLSIDGGEPLPAPWRIFAIAPNQDFRGMARQPGGTLLFDAATAWRYAPEELEELGYDARAIVSTTADAWVQPLEAPLSLEAESLRQGRAVAKQALAVWLRPRDPWRGSLVAFGSASPFQDEEFQKDQYSHKILGTLLRDTLGSPERRVVRRAGVQSAEALPALAPRARIVWRLVSVLFPAVLLLGAFFLAQRLAGRSGSRPGKAERGRGERSRPRSLPRPVLAALAAGTLALLAFAALWPLLPTDGLRLDVTRGGVHALSSKTAELCRSFGRPVTCELVFSNPLPPPLRAGLFELEGKLRDLQRADLDLTWHRTAGEDLSETERDELASRGVTPLRVTSRGEEAQTVRTLYAHAILRAPRAAGTPAGGSGGNSPQGGIEGAFDEVVLDFPAQVAFENLEFRLAATLWRFEHGHAPRIGVASTVPRLSPAEAHVEYRTRGLFAPSGADPYELLRELLRLSGFEVVSIDPADPRGLSEAGGMTSAEAAPALDSVEALVWLQPHRPITPMLAELVRHLRAGKNALVAAQHFDVTSRRADERAAAAGDTSLAQRPQPEFCDLDGGWFAALGIPLAREVLCDAVFGQKSVEVTRQGGGEERELTREETAQPFLIRVVQSGFDASSPLVAKLGDLLFPSGNRFLVDFDALRARGLEVRVLAHSSPRAWAYDWRGGNLPEAALVDPRTAPGPPGAAITALADVPLAVLVEGRFPELGPDPEHPIPELVGPDLALPARLLCIGSGAMFENDLCADPNYDNAGFALNAIADLALGPEFGALMARRQIAPSFAPPAERTRLLLRAGAVVSVPLVLALLGIVSFLRRARSRPAGRPPRTRREEAA